MEHRSHCPVACTLDLIGDRWTMLIIRDLLHGKQFFHEFRASPEKIATNILTDRLKFLEQQGFVVREVDEQDRRRARYQLTPHGESLRTLLRAIADWGLANVPGSYIPGEPSDPAMAVVEPTASRPVAESELTT